MDPFARTKCRVSRWPEVEDVRKSRKYYFQVFMADLRVIHGASVTVFSFGFCCSCIGLAERGAKRSGSEGSGHLAGWQPLTNTDPFLQVPDVRMQRHDKVWVYGIGLIMYATYNACSEP